MQNYRSFSLTWSVAMQIYRNNGKFLQEKRGLFPLEFLGHQVGRRFTVLHTKRTIAQWRTFTTTTILQFVVLLCKLVEVLSRSFLASFAASFGGALRDDPNNGCKGD